MSGILGGLIGSFSPSFNSYESIATVTVGVGGQASVVFSSIPQTYKHLQIRTIWQCNTASWLFARFNSDTSSNTNYYFHELRGNGTTGTAAAGANSRVALQNNALATNVFGAAVIDILDYTDTNKYKVVRSLNGMTTSTAGTIDLTSELWMSTAAISSITFSVESGSQNINRYSSFALYGIKG
jgi:hypothetical protein